MDPAQRALYHHGLPRTALYRRVERSGCALSAVATDVLLGLGVPPHLEGWLLHPVNGKDLICIIKLLYSRGKRGEKKMMVYVSF